MAYGVATNCLDCKLLVSQILTLSNGSRVCADCLQKHYNSTVKSLEESLQTILDKNTEIDSAKVSLAELQSKFDKEHDELVQYKYLAMAAKMFAEAFDRVKHLTEFEHD